MDEKDKEEWLKHLGLPIDVELEDPQGEKFKVRMKSLFGANYIDFLIVTDKIWGSDDKEKIKEEAKKRDNNLELMRLIKESIADLEEDLTEKIASRYLIELLPALLRLNSKKSPKEILDKQKSTRDRMEELRKNDGKSEEDTTEEKE